IATLDHQTGPLGTNYYPTTGGNLSQLIGAGSRSAAAAGLYHHTVRVDQAKEAGAANVSIGYHYVACFNNLPYDSDEDSYLPDGGPDYLEDLNGNGIADTGETPWNVRL